MSRLLLHHHHLPFINHLSFIFRQVQPLKPTGLIWEIMFVGQAFILE